jgi:hypothetical protein
MGHRLIAILDLKWRIKNEHQEISYFSAGIVQCRNAKRFGRIAELVWDDEQKDKDGVFARCVRDHLYPYSRIDPAFAWSCPPQMDAKKAYIKDLVVYAELMHYIDMHKEDDTGMEEFKYDLLEKEPLYPDVQAIVAVESIKGTWV